MPVPAAGAYTRAVPATGIPPALPCNSRYYYLHIRACLQMRDADMQSNLAVLAYLWVVKTLKDWTTWARAMDLSFFHLFNVSTSSTKMKKSFSVFAPL